MIAIPFDPAFAENMDRTQSHGNDPCILCGRKCRNPRYRVYVNSGFTHILTEEEFKTDPGQMGLFPIGANCLRKHPEIQSYVQDANRSPSPGWDGEIPHSDWGPWLEAYPVLLKACEPEEGPIRLVTLFLAEQTEAFILPAEACDTLSHILDFLHAEAIDGALSSYGEYLALADGIQPTLDMIRWEYAKTTYTFLLALLGQEGLDSFLDYC